MNAHWKRDLESLLLHRLVAARLQDDPDQVIWTARDNLARWHADSSVPPWHEEWKRLLDELTAAELCALITSPDEQGQQLRSSTPFAGILDSREREDVLREASRIWDAMSSGTYSSSAAFLASVPSP